MRRTRTSIIFIAGFLICGITAGSVSIAQEAEYTLAHSDIFGKLRRPQVSFSHEIHTEALAGDGCGICHHVQDDQSGKLVYVEGEELSCSECHVRQKNKDTPALREAYHGNCTGCHRRLIKSSYPNSGPTTCGGCHVKQ